MVGKVVVTRSYKTPDGDHFVGFTADPPEELSLKEASTAAHILSLQVELAVVDHAYAAGSIRADIYEQRKKRIRQGYNALLKSGK